jgi:hypothetical protein
MLNYFGVSLSLPKAVPIMTKFFIKPTRLRQAANETSCKMLTFKLLECQPELVEGGFM